jgi:hypothetical protein
MRIFLSFFFICAFGLLSAQEEPSFQFDSSITANRKNVVRLNLAPMLLFGPKSVVIGYERRIKPHQSVSVNVGYIAPDAFVFDEYGGYVGSKGSSSYGFTVAGDMQHLRDSLLKTV